MPEDERIDDESDSDEIAEPWDFALQLPSEGDDDGDEEEA